MANRKGFLTGSGLTDRQELERDVSENRISKTWRELGNGPNNG